MLIRNHRFVSEQNALSLRGAARSLETSRCIPRCSKRRRRLVCAPVEAEDDLDMIPSTKTPWTKESIRQFWESAKAEMPDDVLHKPEIPPVKQETVAALEPDLARVPVEEIIQGLQLCVGEYKPWGPVAELVVEPPQIALPKTLDVVVDDYGLAMCPTHCFAVYSSVAHGRRPRRVSIYPAQAFLLAVYCSNLKDFPPSELDITELGKETVPGGSDPKEPGTIDITTSVLRLPVVHVRVPHMQTFPILFAYFHNSNARELMRNILPVDQPRQEPRATTVRQYSKTCAWAYMDRLEQCTPPEILTSLRKLRGLRANMVALGVSDVELWKLVVHMWDHAVKARARQVRSPEACLRRQEWSLQPKVSQ